jgi:methyltransferase (TIGR00027 family)
MPDRSVAVGLGDFEPSERMGRYLAGRTRFFDRAVVGAIERGVAQLVVLGAGYDGRSLRYARPGAAWFEVDHPDTQADKRARLRRLGIDAARVAFVGFDLREQGLARALVAAGVEPGAPAQLLCEGVAVYLEPAVLQTMLAELRALATPGTRLAMSASAALPAAEAAVRERFAATVGAVGEPVRSWLDADAVTRLLHQAHWRRVEVSERSARAGFVVAAPAWHPVNECVLDGEASAGAATRLPGSRGRDPGPRPGARPRRETTRAGSGPMERAATSCPCRAVP